MSRRFGAQSTLSVVTAMFWVDPSLPWGVVLGEVDPVPGEVGCDSGGVGLVPGEGIWLVPGETAGVNSVPGDVAFVPGELDLVSGEA